jgi:hypothetical protein
VGHLLDDAYTRVGWADETLDSLKEEIVSFREVGLDVKPDPDSEPGKYRLLVETRNPPEPVIRQTSETIGHLRPALDYLVRALAKLGTPGQAPKGTQFLIEDSESGFKGREKAKLKGLSAEHVAAIERLQPYERGESGRRLARLRDLSNPDKHDELVSVASLVDGDFKILTLKGVRRIDRSRSAIPGVGGLPMVLGSAGKVVYDKTGTQLSPTDPFAAKDVNVQLGLSLDITFEDGSPVIKTLAELCGEVRAILDAFKPDF